MFAPWEHDAPSKMPPLSSDTDTFSQYGSNEVSGMSRNLLHLSGGMGTQGKKRRKDF